MSQNLTNEKEQCNPPVMMGTGLVTVAVNGLPESIVKKIIDEVISIRERLGLDTDNTFVRRQSLMELKEINADGTGEKLCSTDRITLRADGFSAIEEEQIKEFFAEMHQRYSGPETYPGQHKRLYRQNIGNSQNFERQF
jgi:hypothetical protein